MPYNFVTNIEICYYNIPQILYYSHIPTAIVALILGIFVFIHNRQSLASRLLLLISVLFSLWSISDIVLFVSPDSRMVMFFWSIINLLQILISITTLYFAYTFLNKEKDAPFWSKLFFGTILISFTLFIHTQNNLLGFDIMNCEAQQGPLINYYYILEIFVFLFLLSYLIRNIIKTTSGKDRKQALLFSFGIMFFTASFSGANLIASLAALLNPDNPDNWKILQYGLFGMPVFMAFLVYLIVKFKTFNIKLLATQALVWVLAVLIGSQFFFIRNPINYTLTAFTFVASIIFGYFLIKSVKREIKQKEELARLNIDLKNLIAQRESLVHLVTHKIKGSFTRSKYIFAGILDGTFGEASPEIRNYATQGLESDNTGINTVDLVLNVANMQKGAVKYDMKVIDFKELILKTFAEKKLQAEAKGLQAESNIGDGNYHVLGDIFWLKEAVYNLIDNSIKYTKEGKITIGLEDGAGKIKFYVKDTGIGITDEDKKNLFTEGGRGKDSVKTNVDSTGYGLYSVKLIIETHKGKVWVESEGPGKGSTFYIELDAV